MSDYYIDENGVIDGFTNKRVEKTGNFFNITEQILSLSDNGYIVKFEMVENKAIIHLTKMGIGIREYYSLNHFLKDVQTDIRIWERNELADSDLRDMSLDLPDVVSLREDGYSVKQNKAGQVYIGLEDCLVLYYPNFNDFINCVNKDIEQYEQQHNIQYKLATTSDRNCIKGKENILIKRKIRLIHWVIAIWIAVLILMAIAFNI